MKDIDVISKIRQLSKSNYYQTLYSASKENIVKLFDNDRDLTDIQIRFLYYLSFYAGLYMDIAIGDVDEIVLKNEIYSDSYMIYKNKKDKKQETIKKQKSNQERVGGSTWIFKTPTKR